jgi:hypothetical protein
MNAEVFAEWLKLQGHKVYRTKSSYWYDAAPHVLQAFPYHWLIDPENDEIKFLMLKKGIVALRYSAPLGHHEGKVSYHIVQSKCYDMQMLKSKARNGIICGLKNFTVEEISFDRLDSEGWYLQQDTLLRQKRLHSMNEHEWHRICRAARHLPGFHAYAAISGGDLAGGVIVARIDDIYSVPYAFSHCRFLRNHVNNALFYSVCCKLLNEEGIKGIFFTVQSLDAPANVDEFKIRMGFEPVPVRQNVLIHPFLKPFVTSTVYSLSQKLLNLYPSNALLAKTEGMLRFHLEGRRSVGEQVWPDCLKELSNV